VVFFLSLLQIDSFYINLFSFIGIEGIVILIKTNILFQLILKKILNTEICKSS